MRVYTKFSRYINKFNKDYIQRKLDEGLTVRMIADIVNIPEKRLSEMIKHFNLIPTNIGVTHIVNHNYFDKIDSEEKAYILGFIVADGCLSADKRKSGNVSKRIAFCNSISDKEIIEKIRDIICPSVNINWKNNSTETITRKDQCNFKFTSSHMFDTLEEKYKITPNKTKDINYKMVDLGEFNRHFVRGFFDGDGTYNRNTLGFVGTSVYFMEQLIEIFNTLGFTTRLYKEKGKTIDYYRALININKKNIQEIYDYFYKDSTVYLTRKKIIFDNKLKNN